MALSNQNLVPTVIADKNGKVTTVHKKSDAKQSSLVAVPAPAISGSNKEVKPTLASRMKGIENVFDSEPDYKPNKAKMKRLLEFSSRDKLQVLDEALSSFDGASEHEQSIIKSIMLPLTSRIRRSDCIFELLAMREAFTSEQSEENSQGMLIYILEEHVYGVRNAKSENYNLELDWTDQSVKEQSIALLRFSYELQQNVVSSWRFSPTYSAQLGTGTDESANDWVSADLVNLISDFPDQVEGMINVATAHQTNDAQLIWGIMQHKGHPSLTSGAL